MDRHHARIEDFKPVLRKQRLYRAQRVIDEMLVIDLVESEIIDHTAEIDRLHDKDAAVGKQRLHAPNHTVQFFQMEEHASCGHEGGPALFPDDLLRGLLIEETHPGGYAALNREFDHIGSRVDAEHAQPERLIMR